MFLKEENICYKMVYYTVFRFSQQNLGLANRCYRGFGKGKVDRPILRFERILNKLHIWE